MIEILVKQGMVPASLPVPQLHYFYVLKCKKTGSEIIFKCERSIQGVHLMHVFERREKQFPNSEKDPALPPFLPKIVEKDGVSHYQFVLLSHFDYVTEFEFIASYDNDQKSSSERIQEISATLNLKDFKV